MNKSLDYPFYGLRRDIVMCNVGSEKCKHMQYDRDLVLKSSWHGLRQLSDTGKIGYIVFIYTRHTHRHGATRQIHVPLSLARHSLQAARCHGRKKLA